MAFVGVLEIHRYAVLPGVNQILWFSQDWTIGLFLSVYRTPFIINVDMILAITTDHSAITSFKMLMTRTLNCSLVMEWNKLPFSFLASGREATT